MFPSFSSELNANHRGPYYTLSNIGVRAIECNQENPHFVCKVLIQNNDIVNELILGSYYYSLIYRIDFAIIFSKNLQFSNELYVANQEKYNLINKFNAIFTRMHQNPQSFHKKYTPRQDMLGEITNYIKKYNHPEKETINLYDFFQWFSIFTSISILLFNSNKTYHFSNASPILTLYLKLEGEVTYLLYPNQYSNELLKNVINNNQPVIEKILSCGHPFPDISLKEAKNLVELVRISTKCQYGCEYLMNEELKLIYETYRSSYPYSETHCSFCNTTLENSSVKCSNCQFSYCFQNCKDKLAKENYYYCAICDYILRPPNIKKAKKNIKKTEDVPVKMHKEYDLPLENSNYKCNHKPDMVFYCNYCKKISYQYDMQVLNDNICPKCRIFFKNSNNLCCFCNYEQQYQNSMRVEEGYKNVTNSMRVEEGYKNVTNSMRVEEGYRNVNNSMRVEEGYRNVNNSMSLNKAQQEINNSYGFELLDEEDSSLDNLKTD
ncbi:hypothetical protein SteCoe_27029 [Stentor coeruleus]|uniref:Uncharacterized protein n=1 Tax=Stentor coeruleus TaxID=5963 RepID=A0A1R2BBI3_9CILI|nr:hypothetical protein SteCoe_27029 [Stentor coeruleus]